MSILDVRTLLIVSALLNTFMGVLFSVDALHRRSDVASRIWALAFINAFVTTFAYIVALDDQFAWWAIGLGNGTFVGVVAAVWAGCRAFNGRPPRLWIAGLAGLCVAIFGAVRAMQVGFWGGTSLLFLGVAVFTALAAAECLRRPMSRYRNSTILATILIVAGIYTAVRLVVFLAIGPNSLPFQTYLGTGVATMVNVILVTGAAFSMAALRSEQNGAPFAASARAAAADAGNLEQLRAIVAELAANAPSQPDVAFVLVAADIDNLGTVNALFGRDFGDRLIAALGTAVRSSAPDGTAVAASGGTFIVLASGDVDDGEFIAERIEDALAEAGPLDTRIPVRVSVTYAWASTDGDAPASELLDSVLEQLRHRKSRRSSEVASTRRLFRVPKRARAARGPEQS